MDAVSGFAMTSKIISRLTGDHLKLAESYESEGNKRKAADAYSKAGDHQRAAALAAEVQDEPRMIRYSLLAFLAGCHRGPTTWTPGRRATSWPPAAISARRSLSSSWRATLGGGAPPRLAPR